MKILLLACCCFLFVCAQAQRNRLPHPFDFSVDPLKAYFVSFKGDSTNASIVGQRYDSALDSKYRMARDYTFEFRLKQYHLQSSFDNVFVLTLRNGKWTARYFDRDNGPQVGVTFTEKPVNQGAVNQLWQLLLYNDVLTLPSQRALSDRLVSYEADTANLPYGNMRYLDVTDGAAYEFSLRTPTGQRYYGYYSPQTYLERYSNVKELFQAVMLITLIEKFLGHPLRVY